MTTPNLDALAKLGPFRCDYPDIRQAYGGCAHLPDVVVALNEWVELRATVADLRAALTLETRKVITCGVAATNPDASLTLRDDYMRWSSPQAERVRALRAERDELRALLELVAGSLLAAQEKRGDAPCSAATHIDEAVAAIARHAPADGRYSEAAGALRSQVCAEAAELDLLRAYRERMERGKQSLREWILAVNAEAGCAGADWMQAEKMRQAFDELGLRDPAPKEASDGK